MTDSQVSLKQDIINRNSFLRKLGVGSAAMLALLCTGELTSCTNEDTVAPTKTGIDFSLDLSITANSALNKNGGYIISNGVVVAKTNQGTFAAVTLICSHEQKKEVLYRTDRFYCTAHGAEFDNTGKGLNNNGKKGIVSYKTTLTGSMLRIYT
jgi:cytochrome b6-f complex iron-sulfur subunit